MPVAAALRRLFWPWIICVSYTHLDVYKRQVNSFLEVLEGGWKKSQSWTWTHFLVNKKPKLWYDCFSFQKVPIWEVDETMKGKYMAYVGSYSYTGKAKGITVFDVDVEKGMFKERCEIEVDNSLSLIHI